MEQIKRIIVTLLQVALWMTFMLAINDPFVIGVERASGTFYANYAFLFDPLYAFTGSLVFPIQQIFTLTGLYQPEAPDSWFPITSIAELQQIIKIIPIDKFLPVQGGLIWWVPMVSIVIAGLSCLFDYIYDRIRNQVWNIVIEYIFQRRKATQYAEALEQRTQEVQRLNNQYRTLAQETHSLKDSVITDELTKVFNKRFFLSRIQQEFDTCRGEKSVLSVIMIDIDYFKKLNDTYGHLAGDTVLKAVAGVMKRFTLDHCYPCRYGGEEFSIIMPRRTASESLEAANLLQENIQKLRFEDIDPNLRVTVSQGICTVDFACGEAKDIKQFDQILQFADQELYRSKMEGRNRVSVHSLVGPKG